MTAQDRRAEREVGDWYDASVRPPDAARGPLWPRVKHHAGAFLTGYALGSLLRRLF
jgi:hypothetical protein